MKISITVQELKEIISEIFGISIEVENVMNKPEEPTLLSDEEVHNEIVSMCMRKKVNLYINEVLTYTTNRPNYESIAEELYPYDGEIVSIIKEDNNWYINTL